MSKMRRKNGKKLNIREKTVKIAQIFEQRKYLLSFTVFFIVFAAYLLFSLQFAGPAYLSDEIGYLTKAAAFTGSSIDYSSSWHAGYSILVSPVFFLLNNPFSEWVGVVVLNSIMWAASAVMLLRLLGQLFPAKRPLIVAIATLATMAYPAWISMSGYAFSTTGFVFVLMGSLSLLISSRLESGKRLFVFSIFSGLLYWIHPMGLAFAGASSLLMLFIAFRKRQPVYLLYIVMTAISLLAYEMVIGPYFESIMTLGSYGASGHYGSTISSFIKDIVQPVTWVEFPLFVVGLLGYVVIATFGVITQSLDVLKNIRKSITPGQAVVVLSLVALIGTVLINAILTAGPNSARADTWIYGRYTELYLLPILGYALLTKWRVKPFIFSAIFLLVAGVALSLYTDSVNTRFGDLNLVNLQAFWPLAFSELTKYWQWFAIAAGVVLLFAVIARWNKKYLMILLVPIVVMTVNVQTDWHQSILKGYSKPSGLYTFIEHNYKKGTCVGIDPSIEDHGERKKLYAYYLHDYTYQRLSLDGWLSDCDGPYLSFASMDSDEYKAIGREVVSGMYVYETTDRIKDIDSHTFVSSSFYLNTKDSECVLKGCINWNYKDNDLGYTKNGTYNPQGLESNGDKGFLLYGPYAPIKSGHYTLVVDGNYMSNYSDENNVKLRVTGNKGQDKYLDTVITTMKDYTFELKQDINDLEIVFFTDTGVKYSLQQYKLIRL